VNRPSPQLAAVRFPLDPGPPIDPFALAGSTGILFHAEGRVLVGLGTALAIGLPHGLDSVGDVRRAVEVLASVPCADRFDSASSGVVGFAALPFGRSEPASLLLPEVIFGSDPDGREWVTVVAADRSGLPSSPLGLRSWLAATGTTTDRLARPGTPSWGPGRDGRPDPADPSGPRIEPRSPDASFLAMVADALAAIDRGQLVKVVLARQVDVTMSGPVDMPALLRRWHRLEPNCTVFSVPTSDGQFVGASPELLVERTGTGVHSRPLAGTAQRFVGSEGSLLPGELLESRKDATEHRLVVEAIEATLRGLCSELHAPSQPDLVHLRNIIHLGTSLDGTLARGPDGRVPNALELVEALHPTPAVGGVPATTARAVIGQLEPESRGHYAGPVGYVDAVGDGRWMVGIRAMAIEGLTARLAAGVGIVDGSTPATELAETNLKLSAVLDVLAPGLTIAPAEGTHPSVVG
jgi:isochorismate synthase